MRVIDADLRDFLESVVRAARAARVHAGWRYNSPHGAVLDDGIIFPHGAYTPEEGELLLEVLRDAQPFERKRCFFNAQVIAQGDPRIGYAEGYVLAEGLPLALEHAWNFIPESGKPVDVTLREEGERTTCEPEALLGRASRNLRHAYRGFVIPVDAVRKHWLQTGRSESLLQDPAILTKIMKEGLPRAWGRAL